MTQLVFVRSWSHLHQIW